MNKLSSNNLKLIRNQNKNASLKARNRLNMMKKVCPEGKEINYLTGRCVKKCSSGKRNKTTGRCIPVKKSRKINNVNKFNELELLPITYAIRNQDLSRIKLLLQNGSRLDIGSELPLYSAVLTGNKSIINLLLKNKANPNQYSSPQSNDDMVFHPPIVAAIPDFEASMETQKNSLSIIRSLLKYGVDINISKFDNGHTVLYSACDNGHVSIIRFLLKNGADPNIQIRSDYDDNGFTPLHIAVKNGYIDIIKELFKSQLLSDETIGLAEQFILEKLDSVYAGQRSNNSGLMPQQIKRNNIKALFR